MDKSTSSFFDKLYSNPKLTIIIIAVISVFFAAQLPRVKIDNNNFNFIPKNDSARILNEEAAKIFGEETPILIGVERQYNTVFDVDFINQLRKIDAELAAMPLVKRTVSILNTNHLSGSDGMLTAAPLIDENYKGTDSEILALRYKLRDWNEMYSRTLVSDDFKAVQFVVFLSVGNDGAGSPEALAVCREALKIAKNWNFPDSSVFVTGAPVISEMVNQATAHDLAILIPIVIFVVVGVLYLSFRRILGVVLPLLTVLLSVDWAVGAMALFGIKLSILSTVLPVILVAVGSAYGIHVVSHYFDEMGTHTQELSREEYTAVIVAGMQRIMWPVFLAALTTFAGFVSFCFTSVVPIFQFGIFASFGVIAAFVIAVVLIPAILILAGPKAFTRKRKPSHEYTKLDTAIAKTFMIIAAHKRTVLFFLLVALLTSAYLTRNVVIDNVLVEYFKNDPTVAEADAFVREKFAGAKEVSLIIQSDKPNEVISTEVLTAVEKFSQYFSAFPEVGKINSLTPLIKRINQVLNSDVPAGGNASAKTAQDNFTDDKSDDWGSDFDDFSAFGVSTSTDDEASTTANAKTENVRNLSFLDFIKYLDEVVKEAPSNENLQASELARSLAEKVNYNGLNYYEIPHEPHKYGKTNMQELQGIINDYMTLLASNVEGFVDNTFSPKVQKVTIQLRTKGQIDTGKVVSEMQKFIKANFPATVSVKIAGSSLIEQSLNDLVVSSQFISLAISLAIVFVILAVYYRSVVAGIIGIIPLILSILTNFAVMALFGIKVNIGTALVAGFAIGIGIDYTIHYLDAYHREIIRTGGEEFLYNTFYGSGKAILFNAISVGAGFAVLVFSDFRILSDLGFLICFVMLVSSIAALSILPVLLNTLKPKFITKVFKRDGQIEKH